MFNEPNPAEIEKITSALAGGNKFEAIQLYGQASGKDLKESKDFIDALIPHLVYQDPEKYPVRLLGPIAIGIVVKGLFYLTAFILTAKIFHWLIG